MMDDGEAITLPEVDVGPENPTGTANGATASGTPTTSQSLQDASQANGAAGYALGAQYDRAFQLTLDGQALVTLAGNPDAALRVKFEIIQKTNQSPNYAKVDIYNMSSARANAIVSMTQGGKMPPVTITAGYGSQGGTIFSGKLMQARKLRETVTDTVLAMLCGDGYDAYRFGVISKALAKGSTPLDHANAFIQALQPFGIRKGYLPTEILSQLKYPRGVSFAGMVRDYLRTLAHSNQCSWSIQNGALNMVPANSYIPGQAFVVNSSTGLIGMPEQTSQGIRFRVLINPLLLIDRQVQINQKDINAAALSLDQSGHIDQPQALTIPDLATDGIYRVYSINSVGDTRGQPWYMDCLAIPLNYGGSLPSSAVQSPYLYPDGNPNLNG